MKKTLLILLLALLSVGAFGQNGKSGKSNINDGERSEHLTFYGVPMYGSVKDFATQLENKGLTINKDYYKEKGSYLLKGNLGHFKNCYIYLDHTHKTKLIFGLQVRFPDRTNWKDLNSDYVTIYHWLAKKYGIPNKDVKNFMIGREPLDDEDRYNAVLYGKAIYGAMFEADYGMIVLYLDNPKDAKGNSHCHATIYLIDTINYDIFSEEAQMGY